jgi:hypothetical protein
MQNFCHICGTHSDLERTDLLWPPLLQVDLVLHVRVVVSAVGLDHALALAVKLENKLILNLYIIIIIIVICLLIMLYLLMRVFDVNISDKSVYCLTTDWIASVVRFPAEVKDFPLTSGSRPALRPT